jgi:NosR/NirI family nitrous oxide reductase transcriptional regulator
MFEHRYDYKLEEALPATKFVAKKGYWEGYKDNKLIGYVVLSKDWTKNLVGYSGKHLETLVGFDINGAITGTKVIFHSEPIVLIGLKEDNYKKFVEQYKGKNIKQNIAVGKEISMDAITGATVTAVVQNAIIIGSARKVAAEAGMMQTAKKTTKKLSSKYSSLSWDELLKSGSVKGITVSSKDVGLEGEDAYLDLYFAVLTPPSIGRNLLGEDLYKDVMAKLKGGESAMAVFSKGKGSFKGSGFARGGVFDRFNLEQDERVNVFNDKDYRIITDIKAKGAPDIKEGGIFIVRDKDFDFGRSFRFNLVLPYRSAGFKKEFKSFSADYKIPERFLE